MFTPSFSQKKKAATLTFQQKPLKVYVGRIPDQLENDSLMKLLSLIAPLKSYLRLENPATKQLNRFCYVEYHSPPDVLRALRLLSNFSVVPNSNHHLVLNIDLDVEQLLDEWRVTNKNKINAGQLSTAITLEKEIEKDLKVKNKLESFIKSSEFGVDHPFAVKSNGSFNKDSGISSKSSTTSRDLHLSKSGKHLPRYVYPSRDTHARLNRAKRYEKKILHQYESKLSHFSTREQKSLQNFLERQEKELKPILPTVQNAIQLYDSMHLLSQFLLLVQNHQYPIQDTHTINNVTGEITFEEIVNEASISKRNQENSSFVVSQMKQYFPAENKVIDPAVSSSVMEECNMSSQYLETGINFLVENLESIDEYYSFSELRSSLYQGFDLSDHTVISKPLDVVSDEEIIEIGPPVEPPPDFIEILSLLESLNTLEVPHRPLIPPPTDDSNLKDSLRQKRILPDESCLVSPPEAQRQTNPQLLNKCKIFDTQTTQAIDPRAVQFFQNLLNEYFGTSETEVISILVEEILVAKTFQDLEPTFTSLFDQDSEIMLNKFREFLSGL